MLKTTPNFALFDPVWKLGEGWARSLYQLLKLYLRQNLQNSFEGHPRAADERGGLIKKSSWVNVGRPNNKTLVTHYLPIPRPKLVANVKKCQNTDCQNFWQFSERHNNVQYYVISHFNAFHNGIYSEVLYLTIN